MNVMDTIASFFKKLAKKEEDDKSKKAAKERLHLVLMQDRANVSADFLEMMRLEIIEVIKKYIDIDENEMDVKLTNKANDDGTNGAPALYANIPIVSIKNEAKKCNKDNVSEENKIELNVDNKKDEKIEKDNIEVKEIEEIIQEPKVEDKKEKIKVKKSSSKNKTSKKEAK